MLRITLLIVCLTSLSSSLFASPILYPQVALSKRRVLPEPIHWTTMPTGTPIASGYYGAVFNDLTDPGVVIKMITDPAVTKDAVKKEATVLNELEELDNWGFTGTEDKPVWYIKMKKIPGAPLGKTPEYKHASELEQKKMISDVSKKAAVEILSICKKTGYHHYDISKNNLLVTFSDSQVPSVRLVDWGSVATHSVPCDPQNETVSTATAKEVEKFLSSDLAEASGSQKNSSP